ncbi:Molybdenum cofactor biosynthesis enzyme and related Fe-S oxidoreductases [hydrothermal vent metagenome]|uniref:Molybdenum cofactor biosynthesis enzyme and related Fe-S oxidoreductases n=1 Tax=hydrothermal vent metagenome TaxID=652676 RepID=A0A1W1BD51_9ZZZZ
MKFHRIYIEITNICGLKCSFCPTSDLLPKTMSLKIFEDIVIQSKKYTKEIALHVMGDPLTLNNLFEYLDILEKYKMKAILTTSGYFIKKQPTSTLFHNAVKQINISLNSYNKNDTSITLLQYMRPIINLCEEKLKQDANLFINLRIWNLDDIMSEKSFNTELFKELSNNFDFNKSIDEIYTNRPKSIRLENKILLHFDNYFEWPSLNNPVYGDGACLGIKSHIAILVDGRVVPCCLDSKGVIELGDLKKNNLDEIMSNNRTQSIKNGFQNGIAVEELCQKCSYKNRFNEQSL